jgi:hypothetical protein
VNDRGPIEVKGAPGRCPFCHDALGDVSQVVACAACGARHHAPCYREHGACSSCAATTVLVPEGETVAAPVGPRSLGELPPGSWLSVTEQPGGEVEISWPLLSQPQFKACLLLGAALAPLFGFGLYLLYFALRYRQARVRLTLTRDAVRLQRPGTVFDRLEVSVEPGQVEQVQTGGNADIASLWVTSGGKRSHWVGSRGVGHVLPVSDVQWLGEALEAWKAGRLRLGEADEPEPADPKKGPARHRKEKA